jgi:hypothetical protein
MLNFLVVVLVPVAVMVSISFSTLTACFNINNTKTKQGLLFTLLVCCIVGNPIIFYTLWLPFVRGYGFA